MLVNLISETVGSARSRAVVFLAALAVGAAVAGCASAPGDLTGATQGDSGRPRAESIGGKVWVDGDGDGQYSVGEGTTEGVTVSLWREANGDGQCGANDAQVGTMVTGAQGDYLFQSLPPGWYCVEVDTDAGATWSAVVEITAGTGQTLNIALP